MNVCIYRAWTRVLGHLRTLPGGPHLSSSFPPVLLQSHPRHVTRSLPNTRAPAASAHSSRGSAHVTGYEDLKQIVQIHPFSSDSGCVDPPPAYHYQPPDTCSREAVLGAAEQDVVSMTGDNVNPPPQYAPPRTIESSN